MSYSGPPSSMSTSTYSVSTSTCPPIVPHRLIHLSPFLLWIVLLLWGSCSIQLSLPLHPQRHRLSRLIKLCLLTGVAFDPTSTCRLRCHVRINIPAITILDVIHATCQPSPDLHKIRRHSALSDNAFPARQNAAPIHILRDA